MNAIRDLAGARLLKWPILRNSINDLSKIPQRSMMPMDSDAFILRHKTFTLFTPFEMNWPACATESHGLIP
jgi:hypothetical protein